MSYFTIKTRDFSSYVNSLKVIKNHNYNAQMNAAGDTVIDYINAKYSIEVGFRPLTENEAKILLDSISVFNVSIKFLDPETNSVKEINCISPAEEFEYYFIHGEKTLSKPFTLTFSQL